MRLLRVALLAAALSTGSAWGSPDTSVLVIGATGRTGGLVVAELLEAGFAVRGMARRVEAGRERLPEVTWFSGDVRDPASFQGAFDGVDLVIYTVGNTRDHAADNPPEQVYYRGVVATVDAARRAGATR